MPLLAHDWTALYKAFYWAGKRRDAKYSLDQAFVELFTNYLENNPWIGSIPEGEFIFETLELAGRHASETYMLRADDLSRRGFCDAVRDLFFDPRGPLFSLVAYARGIVPGYHRQFYRNLENCCSDVYLKAMRARNDLLRNRVNECTKTRADFCVACQTKGAQLGDSVVLLPNCGHTPLCTTCFLAWNKTNNQCPVCRAVF